MIRRPRSSPLFPYPTLSRSGIEVSHAQASRVPAEYVRRQTLAGAERYVTAELREAEATVLGAEERIRRLEYELFEQVRDTRSEEHTSELQSPCNLVCRLLLE